MSYSSGSSIPTDLIPNVGADSISIRRVPVRVASDQSSYSYGSNVIFTLPNDFSDLRNSYMSFLIPAVTQTGGTFIRLPNPVSCMFNRVRVYLGSQLIEDIQDYDVLRGIFYLASPASIAQATTQSELEGSPVAATRATETAAGRMFVVHSRLESLMRVWPLHKIKLPLRYELTINSNAASFLEFDGTNPVLLLNNAYFNYHSIQVPQEVDAMLDASIAAGKCQVRIHSWENYSTSVATSASQQIMLPFKKKYINCMLGVYRDQTSANTAATQDKFWNILTAAANLQQAYAKVGSQIYPSDRYDLSPGAATNRGANMLVIPFNSLMNPHYHALDRAQDCLMGQAITTRVIVPVDLRRDSSPGSYNLWCNGVDTASSATSSNFFFGFWAVSGALFVDVYAQFEVTCTVTPGGGISLDM